MSEQVDILIIEDDPVVREAAIRTLSYEGWSMDATWNREETVSRLESRRYRLVLCDLMLPGLSGFDLLDLGRTACPGTPFVLITGYSTFEKSLRAFRSGAFDFVPKPFDAAELVGVVDRALRFSARPEHEASPSLSDPGCVQAAGEKYRLGEHSWALLRSDGSATLGVGSTFAGTVAGLDEVELPEIGEHALQGKVLAQLFCGDRATHRVWAPLSGSVLAVNDELRHDHEILDHHDPAMRWLVRIVPSQPDLELALLTRD